MDEQEPKDSGQSRNTFVAEQDLIEKEITLRQMRLPPEARLTRKSLLRWTALSLGLITPGESRDTIISILDALFYHQIKGRRPTTRDIKAYIDQNYSETTEKTIRYQLGKLRESGFVEKSENTYSFIRAPNAPDSDLKAGIFLAMDKHYGSTKGRLDEAITSLISQYLQQ